MVEGGSELKIQNPKRLPLHNQNAGTILAWIKKEGWSLLGGGVEEMYESGKVARGTDNSAVIEHKTSMTKHTDKIFYRTILNDDKIPVDMLIAECPELEPDIEGKKELVLAYLNLTQVK